MFRLNLFIYSHDHQKQYQYVLQSLTLWREVLHGKRIDSYPRYQRLILTSRISIRYVPSLVPCGDRPPQSLQWIPTPRYRSGSESNAARAEDSADDAAYSAASPEEHRFLGRLKVRSCLFDNPRLTTLHAL